ncbi:tripartite tricarboxylate transporter substrate binding protein [Siccirubricoccus sp. KC 17139]|uniref:Tripartite tricarboxylate transporter substrate binding protein n=1 Tax=Siccirubricoccus soli TaxID=2899147 RepID=A0ABT1D7A0_9PROT|nr:tripartite tricarboxylate transporter substrate binding protein [Siccirubricoccus soli]MCO6417823.1 tripartite tricarboxylate transporter substrate binding protein [Siccirubricoccus soli]MCP2683958.1 tripartite tricarboxylate transporter substrate binding protein [Siccirubricoccus soli]
MRRRALLAGLALLPAPSRAQGSWPEKPVRILVGFPPGGLTDVLARVLANALQPRFGQPFLVENRTGASGIIAAELVAKSPPDGHTLLLAHPTAVAIAPALAQRLPFDGARAFAPVTLLARQPHVLLAKGDSPWTSLADLVAEAKRRPGAITFASSGVGSVQHIQAEQFCMATGIEAVHVPYRGSAPTMTDLAAGQVHWVIDGVGVSAPLIEAGSLKALGTAAPRRIARWPSLPTFAEQGVEGVVPGSWFGLMGPAGMPPRLVAALAEAAAAALTGAEAQRALTSASAEAAAEGPEAFANFLAVETGQFRALAQRTRISLE